MHLGKRPSRLPADLQGVHGIEPASLDPRAAWAAVVERALELRVDAVLLAGDVVDSGNHFMEAYGALHAGVQRLTKAGIDVVAVAGNHDVEALPRLADELEGFVLLGRGGEWGSHVVERDGEPVVRILGWSFPRARVESSPLDALTTDLREGRYADAGPDDLRTVGLLHCDLDAGGGHYAPVTRRELGQLALGVSAWFLGHIHQPSIEGGGRPVGYLGSLVGLDPGEQGPRGPWLARSAAASWELEQIVLSPVLWESVDIDVSECAEREAVDPAITHALHDLAARLAPRLDGVRVVGVRPRLVGRTGLTGAALAQAGEQARALQLDADGVLYFIDKVLDGTRPAIDLEALAQRNDPLAIVARRLLELEAGGEACHRLIAAARPRFAAVAGHANFSRLGGETPGDGQIHAWLLRAASRALDELLAQKGVSAGAAEAEEVQV